MNLRVTGDFLMNKLLLKWQNATKLIRRFNKYQHQLTSTTSINRYPELFATVQEINNQRQLTDHPRILSFGCSTGAECFSLKQYFNQASIIGADINKFNLLKARSKNKYKDVKFIHSDEDKICENGPYDIVFCLSVLCRWNDTEFIENCEDIYPFEKFDETVRQLARSIKTGGLLIIYNSNFRFEDASIFDSFTPIITPSLPDSGFVHKFDNRNQKTGVVHSSIVYQKR